MASSERFAPPTNEFTDPNDYLNEHALARRREIHAPTFEEEPATESERFSALATLMARANDEEQHPAPWDRPGGVIVVRESEPDSDDTNTRSEIRRCGSD